MTADGLPVDQYLVGGGFEIAYVAPVDGTAVWANKNNGQILMTQTMTAGETFEQSADPTEEDFMKVMGQDASQVRLVLYFTPSSP